MMDDDVVIAAVIEAEQARRGTDSRTARGRNWPASRKRHFEDRDPGRAAINVRFVRSVETGVRGDGAPSRLAGATS